MAWKATLMKTDRQIYKRLLFCKYSRGKVSPYQFKNILFRFEIRYKIRLWFKLRKSISMFILTSYFTFKVELYDDSPLF